MEQTPTPPSASTALCAIKAILQESQRPYKIIFPLISFVDKLIEQLHNDDNLGIANEETTHD